MLKLKNVGKTYISKGKQKVEALKDVNLEIGDRGLVFILGKSGSGKSTLLNILGGIDGATSGEISVDDQSFAQFKQADYDNYRNGYVGFVFQEFNLLHDFDVSGNVALALRLSRETDVSDKVKSVLRAVGLSDAYLTRKIDELSGGEKQRVAIARAMVKESKLILADEPTGNLDSATGESIWNILKELSKSKLVIVVTHDRESAEKYGDRIIEISDGAIISDSGEQPATQGEVQRFSPKRKGLSNAVCFKMGANNLLQRKVKSVSVVLLAIFTIFAVLITQVLVCFSPEKSIAKFIKDNDIDYIELTQGKLRYGNEFDPSLMLNSTAEYIEKNTANIKNNFVENKQDILDMGLTFAGEALELDDNSYYLTTSGLERAYHEQQSYVEVDGEKVKLRKDIHPAEFLIGKKVDIGGFHTLDYTLAGVIDLSDCNPLSVNVFPAYFSKENFAKNSGYSEQYNAAVIPDITVQFGDVKYTKDFYVEDSVNSTINSGGGKVLTENGLREPEDVTLADDEIVLTYKMYDKLFTAEPKWSYISTDFTEVISVPQHIGQSFSLKFYDYDSGELLIDAGELKIVGISFSYTEYENTTYNYNSQAVPRFAVGKNKARKINIALGYQGYIVQVASIENLQKFLVNFRNKHEGYVAEAGKDESTDYSRFIYGFDKEIYLFKIIFLSLAVVLSLILLLFVINLISFSILNRKKEIGILSALGATNKDITKIFLIETLLISVVTFVVNIIAIIVATTVFNNLFGSLIYLHVPLLRVDIVTVVTLFAASFVLLLLAALIPIRKIIKLKPIDAIKNI